MIKAHNITLTIFVFIYIPPIYIFWKSSPLPQSIVYLISTHTTKSSHKIIPKVPQNPQQHSPKITLISQINLTLPPLQSYLSQHIPSHQSNIITPLITLFIHSPILPIYNIITLSRPYIQHPHPNNPSLNSHIPFA